MTLNVKAPSLEKCLIVNDENMSNEILSRASTTGTANTVLKGDKSAKQSHFPNERSRKSWSRWPRLQVTRTSGSQPTARSWGRWIRKCATGTCRFTIVLEAVLCFSEVGVFQNVKRNTYFFFEKLSNISEVAFSTPRKLGFCF